MKRVIQVLSVFLLLYIVALHISMAGMETMGWLTAISTFGYVLVQRRKVLGLNIVLPYLLFVVLIAVSLLATPLEKPFMHQFGVMRFGVLMIGVAWALDAVWNQKFEIRLRHVWAVVLLLVAAYAVLQCLFGIDLLPRKEPKVLPHGHLFRSVGFFSQPLTFAYLIGMSFFASVRWKPSSALYPAASIVGFVGLFTPLSRGAWLASIVCLVIYLFFERRRWLLPFLAAVGVMGSLLLLIEPTFQKKVVSLFWGRFDTSSIMRFDLWRAYWAMFLDHPFLGVGIFEGDRLLDAYYAKLGIVQEFKSHAHNNFLQVLAGSGLFGFSAWIWLISIPFIQGWRLRAVSDWGWPLFLAQLFVHIGGLTEMNFFDAEVTHFLMFVWAMTMVLYQKEIQRGSLKSSETLLLPRPRKSRDRR